MKLSKIKKGLINPKYYLTKYLINHLNSFQEAELRKKLKECGCKVSFAMPICIEGAENVKIGNRVSIARFIHIWGHGGVEIGDDTLIASHVAITSLTHDVNAQLFTKSSISKPIIIGSNVWIGSHATILPGIRIGDGAIVGAGAVVTKDVEENAIVVGVPAKLLRYRL